MSHFVFGPVDEIHEDVRRSRARDKLVSQQLFGSGSLLGSLRQARVDEMLERLGPVRRSSLRRRRQRRRIVLGNVVERRHSVHVEERRLPLRQLDASDAQRPNVHFAVVLSLVHGEDHLGRHPVRSSDERVGRREHGGRTKIRQFHRAAFRQQNITGFYVPMNSPTGMQICQSLRDGKRRQMEYFLR